MPQPAPLPDPARPSRWRSIGRVLCAAFVGLVGFLVLGNLLIAGAWQLQASRAEVRAPEIDGIDNLRVVDERVWRGAAPSEAAYGVLAGTGVTTIVDLRAEENVDVDDEALGAIGLRYVHLPIRDGQVPTRAQVDRFLAEVDRSPGLTFVHCGAGVGRTGAMAAAYLVATGRADGVGAMGQNLAVGPPSLEQLAFAASLDGGVERPPAVVVAASRVLDAPRRLWSRLGL